MNLFIYRLYSYFITSTDVGRLTLFSTARAFLRLTTTWISFPYAKPTRMRSGLGCSGQHPLTNNPWQGSFDQDSLTGILKQRLFRRDILSATGFFW